MDTKLLRQKILDLAIRGKLVPQDPNDEPASVLLERIKAEKEQLIKEGKIKRSKKTATTSDSRHYPFELPSGWVWTTLGEIGKWQAGGTPNRTIKSYYGGEIPWLKTGDLNDGIIENIPESITEEALQNSSAKLNPTNSILIAMYGATIGKLGILSYPAATNQACCACIEYSAVEKYYLFYFLLSHRHHFIYKGGGGAQPNISKEKILNTAIPLPPIEEQRRIIKAIEKWFLIINIVEANKNEALECIKVAKNKILDLAIHGKLVPQHPADEPAIKLLKRVNPSAEITCDNEHYPQLPNGWILLKGKYVFNPLKSTKPKTDIFKYIDIDSIDNKKQCVRQIKKLAASTAPSRASRYTRKGDVLFAMVRPYLKNIAIVPESDCIASTGFYICSSNGIITTDYCYYLMSSDYVINGLNQYMKGDNSPSISKNDIENWEFPVPPINEQIRITESIKILFSKIDNIAENL